MNGPFRGCACKKAFGKDYAKGGKECDEYPFATTHEGCAQNTYEPSAPKNNFSVRPLAKKDNGNAGNLLGVHDGQPHTRRRRRRLLRHH
ncbi:NucA/NucB deoxyribonuclease domain-containing protein [Streptomyces caniscabiei]|uniref:NucA/NucB deoxyribonuclease domain-containing protein n=1 Tax=Streptomyces caniscabiei TaxID=2746961 RepID=UPI000A3B3933